MDRKMRRVIVLFATLALVAIGALPALAVPGNDAFADAELLALPDVAGGDTTGATTEAGEPAPSCSLTGSTVWYTSTPLTDTNIDLSTFGSKFDTIVAAYTGTGLGDLSEIGCNDDAEGTGSMQSMLSISVGAGETAFIQVGGYLGASGVLKLSANAALLDNDLFAFADEITALPFTVTQSTTEATNEAGEPEPGCGPNGGTRWFRYTPAAGQVIRVDTIGSDFDTMLAVYTGPDLSDLTLEACNDDGGFTVESIVTLALTGGTTYHIQAGGLGTSAGELVLNAVELIPPANDDFDGAADIANPGQATVDTSGATNEPGEPDPCFTDVGSTVWYQYTAAQPGPVLVDTYNSDYDTVLGVYTGSDLEGVALVGCADDTNGLTSDVGFVASPGETYHIQVGGFFGETGNAAVRVRTGASGGGAVSAGTDGSEVDLCVLGLCVNLPLI